VIGSPDHRSASITFSPNVQKLFSWAIAFRLAGVEALGRQLLPIRCASDSHAGPRQIPRSCLLRARLMAAPIRGESFDYSSGPVGRYRPNMSSCSDSPSASLAYSFNAIRVTAISKATKAPT
jgi:hypothetical protein